MTAEPDHDWKSAAGLQFLFQGSLVQVVNLNCRHIARFQKPLDRRRAPSVVSESEAAAPDDTDLETVAGNTAEIKTVCLALGPYRNLTTLTAGMLFLHPNCQVLNHAGMRIFGDKNLDFLIEYSDEKFESFLQYGIYNSQTGRPGGYGGSITYSHAFENGNKLRDIFEAEGGDSVKKNVECFFWKESLMTSFHIRDNSVDLDKLFSV